MSVKMKKSMVFLALSIFFIAGIGLGNAMAKKKLTVAYFPGWPCTFEIGWAKGWFEKEMGVKIDFREFDTGAAMTTAMASGSVDIGYSIGSLPFVAAVTEGVPLTMVGVALGIGGDAENFVVRDGSGIKTPKDLVGKTIAVPYGTNPHLKLIGLLDLFGIKENKTVLQLFSSESSDTRKPDCALALNF